MTQATTPGTGYDTIGKPPASAFAVTPHMSDYDAMRQSFGWDDAARELHAGCRLDRDAGAIPGLAQPDSEAGSREPTMGLRGMPEGELTFDNLEVPAGMAVRLGADLASVR